MGFKAVGFPSNDDIPEKKKKKKATSGIGRDIERMKKDILNPESLKKMLPPDVLQNLDDIAKQAGSSVDDILQESVDKTTEMFNNMSDDQIEDMLKSGRIPINLPTLGPQFTPGQPLNGDSDLNDMFNMLNQLGNMINNPGSQSNPNQGLTQAGPMDFNSLMNQFFGGTGGPASPVEDPYIRTYKKNTLLNISTALFNPENFESVRAKTDYNLYENFKDRYGESGWNLSNMPEILVYSGDNVPIGDVDELQLIDYTDLYILMYAEAKDKSNQGFFVAVIENPDTDEFEIVVPEFGNSYSEEGRLFNIDTDPEMFDTYDKFKLTNLDKVRAGLDFMLTPARKCLISIEKFGKVVPGLDVSNKMSRWLRVGKIVSNESLDAKLFKRDANLSEFETSFDLYFKLPEEITPEAKHILTEYISKINFEDTYLVSDYELKYDVLNDRIYIDVNLGGYLDGLPAWKKMDSDIWGDSSVPRTRSSKVTPSTPSSEEDEDDDENI